MKFVPRKADGRVNISEGPHLLWFVKLLLGLVVLVAVLYLALGLIADQIASRISVETELKINALLGLPPPHEPLNDNERYLQGLVDRLAAQVEPPSDYDFRVEISCTPRINALAVPGGKIVMFSGLLEELMTENEVAMILGHEIGHHLNHDQLRKMGRRLVPLAIGALLGFGGGADGVIEPAASLSALRYSRGQERAADLVGLELLQRAYGHANGAVTAQMRLSLANAPTWMDEIPDTFSTHPKQEKRIDFLRRIIKERGYPLEAVQALPVEFKNTLCE